MEDRKAIIIGAGAAGITAAYYLVLNSDIKPIIIEAENVIGGLAKTVNYDGILADIGPHRFFTKDEKVMDLWKQVLPLQGKGAKDDLLLNRYTDFKDGFADPETEEKVFLRRRRFSRIYYKNKFFDYPVKMNLRTVLNLGIWQTMLCGFSYIKSVFIKRNEVSLEDFMINRFGKVLYKTFFEFYTQKVWGRHPKNISKEWGEQRIKGLSLLKTLLNKFSRNKETSLVEEYFYPKYGAGQMWDEMAKVILERGGEIRLGAKVVGIELCDNKIKAISVDGSPQEYCADYIISSMPVKDLICSMNNVPKNVYEIAQGLPYRDYQLISYKVKNFKLKNETDWPTVNNICPDSWIYIQDRNVTVGRIYIPKNFSPYMASDDTLICLEYFCDKGDKLWEMSDEEIFKYGLDELEKINALEPAAVERSYRLKVEKAYPAYFDTYKDFDKIKDYINSIDNLYLIGRNGQHKYNNMDHSVLSGIKAAEAIINGSDKCKLWDVNTEQSYQETK